MERSWFLSLRSVPEPSQTETTNFGPRQLVNDRTASKVAVDLNQTVITLGDVRGMSSGHHYHELFELESANQHTQSLLN